MLDTWTGPLIGSSNLVRNSMNPKLKPVLVVSLILAAASGQVGATDEGHARAEPQRASFPARAAPRHSSPQPAGVDLPLANNYTVALVGDALDREAPGRYPVRLYPVERGTGRVAFTGPALASDESVRPASPGGERIAPRKTFLPEPGNWAMILAGLLGVSAIARRRMSA